MSARSGEHVPLFLCGDRPRKSRAHGNGERLPIPLTTIKWPKSVCRGHMMAAQMAPYRNVFRGSQAGQPRKRNLSRQSSTPSSGRIVRIADRTPGQPGRCSTSGVEKGSAAKSKAGRGEPRLCCFGQTSRSTPGSEDRPVNLPARPLYEGDKPLFLAERQNLAELSSDRGYRNFWRFTTGRRKPNAGPTCWKRRDSLLPPDERISWAFYTPLQHCRTRRTTCSRRRWARNWQQNYIVVDMCAASAIWKRSIPIPQCVHEHVGPVRIWT